MTSQHLYPFSRTRVRIVASSPGPVNGVAPNGFWNFNPLETYHFHWYELFPKPNLCIGQEFSTRVINPYVIFAKKQFA